MIKFILAIVLVVSASRLNAQFQLGGESTTSNDPIGIIGRYLEDIENARSIFVYREADEEHLDELKAELKSVWTVNELVFMAYDDFKDYEVQDGECCFTVSTYYRIIQGSGGSVSYLCDFALAYWRYKDDNVGFFSYTQLYVPLEINLLVMAQGVDESNVVEKLYTEKDIRNWNIGFLKTALADVSNNLKSGVKRGSNWPMFRKALVDLKTEKLYISEDVLIQLHRVRRKEEILEDKEGLLKDYEFQAEIVSNKTLDDLAVDGEKHYCLTVVRNSLNNYVVVYEAKSGDIVYAVVGDGFNFSKGDLEDLEEAIKDK